MNNHETEQARRIRSREFTLNNLQSELNTRNAMQRGIDSTVSGGGTINGIEIDPVTGELIEPPRVWLVGDPVGAHPLK